MKRGIGVLLGLAWALAQGVSLPEPQGPVVEAGSPTVSATFRVQGCARDQRGQVVCALQIQSTARTNQQVTVLHQSVRAISARGFSYPGYLDVEGGQVEANRTVFALPAGARLVGKVVLPKVAAEENFLAALYLGGLEFRGLPIGQAAPAQPAPQAQPQAQTAEGWKATVGPFTLELAGEPALVCCTWVVIPLLVVSNQDARLQIGSNFRMIFPNGIQRTGGEARVPGDNWDFIAGIPMKVFLYIVASSEDEQNDRITYLEFWVHDGKDWQKVVWRDIPWPKKK
ncbi:hypothetical protein [Thermus filiformis]|uniref:Uncharacterized protein n=1 Tax=Thermus filiformis TaxID=276 RepID=A0A0A2WS19_THEFI|nr:hypothetical protein [Thermus filiformis]KGQ22593.1 hypothetical protein THFILI_04135 [Thermus filiformis]